ncbi:hypothetical protein [Ktedonobacter racemifer]|uniref:DUF1877 family protein n=1 Tax=Ktedonobacter racemifer DSM 44963 TaxID=485913 RepID=D6TSN3_KTERA|nr:hypothetical protein [Ktedonobacter racemifer]EFH83434.1 hypothetical protein Krac_4392 [Ktedonobacter racemifer DSM 44963]
MDLTSDAFIATEIELEETQFMSQGNPGQFFPTMQGKNVDPLMLAQLELIVTDVEKGSLHDILASLDERMLGEAESTERWVYQFPTPLTTRLAALQDAEISRYGAQWGATKEWQSKKGLPPTEAATQFLQQLCQLAVRAHAETKNMYMWISL